jgi:tetratricopeptide (TPR) repeat protein
MANFRTKIILIIFGLFLFLTFTKTGEAGLEIGLKEAYAEPVLTEDALKKAIELDPKSEGAYIGLGWLYHGQGQYPKSEEAFKKVVALNPKNADGYVGLGWLSKDKGQLPEAEKLLKKAVELDPKSEHAYYMLGQLYQYRGDVVQAISNYTKAIAINPSFADPYSKRAASYQKIKEYDKAWADVHKAEKLGSIVDPAFLTDLSKVSGRVK